MIAEKNKYMSEAAMAMYELNADEIIRQQCMAREEYNRYEKMMARKLAEANEQIEKLTNQNKQLKEELNEEKKKVLEALSMLEAEKDRYKELESTIDDLLGGSNS